LIFLSSSSLNHKIKKDDDFGISANLTKFNTHINASMTMSNNELNNICPHAKGSTKSKFIFIQHLINTNE
jgi:hypothetical protein